MKFFNTAFLLLAAATLTIGSASAQTSVIRNTPNAKPDNQPGSIRLRSPLSNIQILATRRSAAIDNVSYVNQLGTGNFGSVVQTGRKQEADMVQVNTGPFISVLGNRGNDGYQTQNNGAGAIGQNRAYMLQIGDRNYADQLQSGNLNVAIVTQGDRGRARNLNYSVQCQTGSNNYGYVDQNSNRNFAHQDQRSPITTSAGNGNFADTRQGGAGGAASDGQWSQILQNGQRNTALVRQDNP